MKPVEEMYSDVMSIEEDEGHQIKIQKLNELLQKYPKFAPAHEQMGAIHYQLGNFETAVTHFEAAARFDPDNIQIQKNLGNFYYTVMSRNEDALECYRKILSIQPNDIDITLTTANLLVALHRFEEAEELYENLLRLEPWRLDIQNLNNQINNRNAKVTPGGSEERYQLAQRMVGQNDIKGAIEILQQIVKDDPGYAIAHNDLGVLRYQIGEIRETQAHYEKAVALDPDNIIFKKNLAEYYLVANSDIKSSLELYLSILKDHPYDVETLTAAALISRKLGLDDNARVFCDAILDIEPWNMEASQWLAEMDQGKQSAERKNSLI
jgi:tetratricopeptide (TPR) repeat protein